ncbi:MAG: TonB-dependent receptor [Bacteroidota bacterium]
MIFVVFFIATTIATGQNLDKKISIKAKNKALGEIINQIGELAQINFSYSSQVIPVDKTFSIKATNKTVRFILNELFKDNGIEYLLVENQVILKLAKKTSEPPANKQAKTETRKFTISGYLKDALTGEVLIGAYIFAKGTHFGTAANEYGYFSLTIPSGNYTLMFSFIGYKTLVEDITLLENTKITRELEMAKTEIKPVEIIGNNKESPLGSLPLSLIKLSPKALAQLPGFVGDIDIIKSLQSVPGIKTYGDGSALFYVRGGNSDENLILVDEAPIYNPSHLFGFFSALAPDAINDAEVYKGDFPAKYGGRLSSVIDIKIKEGNMKKFGFGGSIGPYTSYLSLEAPIKKDRCSFFVSGRKSTLFWLSYLQSKTKKLKLNFFDVNAKINLKVNDNNRLYLSFYAGQDNYSRIAQSLVNTFGISWDNVLGSFRWNHIFNAKLFSNTTAYYSRYNYFLYLSREEKNYWKSAISELAIKSDFSYFVNANNIIRTGLLVSAHTSNPGNVHFANADIQAHAPVIPRYTSLEYALYASNEQQIGEKLTLNYGVRLPVWQNLGATTVYSYNSLYQVFDTTLIAKNKVYSTYFSPEPRFSIQYSFTKKTALKLSYSRTSQFVQILTNSVGPFTSLEVWVPCGPNIKPQKTDQIALGFYQKLFRSRVNFSLEGFYKHFYNTIDYRDHANMLYNPLIEGELRFGKAWSYGAELMLRKTEGKLTGWIGYIYSRSFKKIVGVNKDEVYAANYDSPHNIYVNLSFDTKKRWYFSANWMYMTGNAITTPISFYYYNGSSVPIYGAKNNDRLPAYHRLDLSVALRLSKPYGKYQHSLMLTFYNAYGRKNPFSVNNNKMDADGNIVVPADNSKGYDLIQTSVSVAGIIPSINYKFKF